MSSFIPSVESVLRRAVDLFKAEFECCPEAAACAPGRVNLIGEHTDYNEGFVLPMALPLVTIMTGRANGTNEVRLFTATEDVDSPQKIKFSLNEIRAGKPKWANYVKGVVANFKDSAVPGFDAVIVSTVPVGGGISSSAALEVACYTFLEVLLGKSATSSIEKAQACQEAEHVFAGVPCGITDQLVSILGRENCALFLDCRSLKATQILLDDPDIVILITNSNVKHEISNSAYTTRRKECEEAAVYLGKKSLRDALQSDLLELEKKKVNKNVIARARHVITENRRTEEAAKALEEKNYSRLGNLMLESHNSLRDDFEVSHKTVDKIVEAASEVDGVYGCRMTGGGFGGCTVTVLKKDAVEKCIANIKLRCSDDPVFFICKPSAGARPLRVTPN